MSAPPLDFAAVALRCGRCACEIDPEVDYYACRGWTRRGEPVVLREVETGWACRGCVVAMRAGAPS
jgi:hypothetical protein